MSIEVKYGADGLVPVVAQDDATGAVLMVAYANVEAVERTRATGFAHFFSRSRGRLWMKGESSGNRLAVREVRIDCDGDTLLYRVRPEGPACHTGETTCFFRTLDGADPSPGAEVLAELEAVLKERMTSADPGSYTAKLLKGEKRAIHRKVQEEAFEVVLASECDDRENLRDEVADLLLHAMLLLVRHGVPLAEVFEALRARRGKRRPPK